MKEEKNHVGRPTNEEVKIRKKKKILRIVLPVLIFVVAIIGIIAFQNISENKLVGAVNTYAGDLHISASNKNTHQDGCLMVIPIKIKNISLSEKTINKIGLKYYGPGDRWIQQESLIKKIPAMTLVEGELKVDLKKIDASVSKLTIVVYYNNGNTTGDTYYVSENLKIGDMWYDRIKSCKAKATTAKKTALKTGLKLDCPETVTANKEFTCKTNSTGAKISVTSNGLAKGYHTSFTTTTKDKTKQSKYTKAVTVTVKVEKTGYQPVTKKVKIVSGSSKAKNPVLNGGCWAKLSAIGNTKLKYTTQCNGNAKVTNIAYKSPFASGFINRGSGWGAYKGGSSTIVFASRNKGKNITVRVYYDTNTSSTSRSHYKDQSIILK